MRGAGQRGSREDDAVGGRVGRIKAKKDQFDYWSFCNLAISFYTDYYSVSDSSSILSAPSISSSLNN